MKDQQQTEPTVEAGGDKSTYQQELEGKLAELAERKFRNLLVYKVNQLSQYQLSAFPDELPTPMRDNAVTLQSVFELDAVGMLSDVLSTPVGQSQTYNKLGAQYRVERLSDANYGMSISQMDDLDEVVTGLRETVLLNEISQAFLRVALQLMRDTSRFEDNQSFSLVDQPLTTAVVFEQLGLFGIYAPKLRPEEVHDIQQTAINRILQAGERRANLHSDGTVNSINCSFGEGILLRFIPDDPATTVDTLAQSSWRLMGEKDLDPLLKEKGNQAPSVKCESFIHRSTGQAIIVAMERAGLRFSADFEQFVVSSRSHEYDERYGGVYTQLSRVFAKCIWSGSIDRLKNVFVSATGAPPSVDELWLLAEHETENEGVRHIQALLAQILNNPSDQSEIEPTETQVKIQNGACFDVTSYYCQAVSQNKTYARKINGKPFLLKTHGSNTLMNAEPIMFKGINLPRGSLFTIGGDGKLAFLRFTPFMFDTREDMVSSFGTEVLKAEAEGGDLESVLRRLKEVREG